MRELLLQQIANVWTVSDSIQQSDAVVILGGGVDDKSEIAADLLRRGFAKKILISDVLDTSHAIVGGHYSDTTLSREALRRYKVPDNDVDTFGSGNLNTKDEAVALKEWSDKNPVSSFIIPTGFLFSRRVSWIFNHEFTGTHVRIAIYPFETVNYNEKNWWQIAEGRRAFGSELVKTTYYFLRY